MQSRWYPDVQLDNVFWHDHVDGIHGWGKGLVGQLIVEPRARPTTTRRRARGRLRHVRGHPHRRPARAGPVSKGAFRELVLWTMGDNPVTDSTFNLRAEPWADRLAPDADPSLLFSSYSTATR